jgi:hypothetical protein
LRLEPRFRTALYAVMAVLFATGGGWLVIDWLKDAASPGESWPETSTDLLMLHGGAAMLFLLLLGALIALHVRAAWRSSNNHVSGVVMLASNAMLIATAFALYYVGSDTLRRWASDIHIAVGLGFPMLLGLHVFLGKRSVRASQRDAMADSTPGRADADRSTVPCATAPRRS